MKTVVAALASAVVALSLVIVLCVAQAQSPAPVALGVNVGAAPGKPAGLHRYAALVGRRPAVVMWYQQWSEPLFYRKQMRNTKAIRALPMITWDPIYDGAGIPLASIVNGSYDSYIKASARAAAAWGRPMYIRFAHEMNLKGPPFGPGYNGNTPSLYIAAWRHVVRIFRKERATNVQWVWSPNVYCDGKCPFKAYFPGNPWVNWVALDGYNYASVDHIPWMTFRQIFGPSYRVLSSMTSKPMMIGETASVGKGGSKAHWIRQALSMLPQKYPHIRALVWFDRIKDGVDWRVNSSPSSLRAWRQMATSAAYSGTAGTLEAVEPFRH